jgi:two-component system chemotaxis response regulator CheB
MNIKPIRLLIVDDSSVARTVVARSLASFKDIEIVGMANDPYVARDKILELAPDVVTLDIEMPRMDGITFLKLIMKHRPMPVIIMSSLTTAGSEKAMEALQAGAVDVLDKPNSYSASSDGTRLADKIRAAALARVGAFKESPPVARPAPRSNGSAAPGISQPRKIILIGASTGGTEAIRTVLTGLSDDLPGICIVQHIPAYFSKAFADRLNSACAMHVREAKNGDTVTPGLALIAPGGFHMMLKWEADHYKVELSQGPQVHFQRPAVDILFDSAVRVGAAPHAIAALLTGMGADGAAGLLRLRQAGAATIAQNEESCVVYGMPREAVRLGAAQKILPLNQIASCFDIFATARPGAAAAPQMAVAGNSVKH